jgi:hypothetical protein
VLIEIKRDLEDIERRKEAFEFQAIRYAASYATIKDPDDLVKKVYAPYIEKYRSEFELGELTSYELGIRKVSEFLTINDAENSFNKKQKIILVASDFNEQTLSAVAWLNSNDVDISCYRLIPYKFSDGIYIQVEKLLPVSSYDEYYVDLMEGTSATTRRVKRKTRRSLPRIDAMLGWGVVKEGDIIIAKGKDDEATLLANGNVQANGEEMSLQRWLKGIYGWSSVETYGLSIHKGTGKTLSGMRREYMEKESSECS